MSEEWWDGSEVIMGDKLYVGPNDKGFIPREYWPLQQLADSEGFVRLGLVCRDGDRFVPVE